MECLCCNKEAESEIQLDVDMAGFPFCFEHRNEVTLALLLVRTGSDVHALERIIKKKRKMYKDG
jgi:hypothetical protein